MKKGEEQTARETKRDRGTESESKLSRSSKSMINPHRSFLLKKVTVPDSVERLCSQVDSSRLGFMLFRFGTRTHGLVVGMGGNIDVRKKHNCRMEKNCSS